MAGMGRESEAEGREETDCHVGMDVVNYNQCSPLMCLIYLVLINMSMISIMYCSTAL